MDPLLHDWLREAPSGFVLLGVLAVNFAVAIGLLALWFERRVLPNRRVVWKPWWAR